ncbi:MerR family transcriptional regulator [Streptomyces millisiae]|uniref:MerR family transcriptional regulator n=1 Tax=Streptomyces millisiae TaxID=3075542 RepID=A0ABU2LR98_9ACTN|nr:MerR family transcriptional regulator [Streptomyces sp. DSM 44918]MDT0320121.1 MerR family transcriptional regulator [Streptomyces sp. DSM 44918]
MERETDQPAEMSIGAFARRVGVAPSALRFYDDCGLLRPDRVDAVTGYRYYAPEQEARAVAVRRLRDAGLPLVDVAVVLDGSAEEARAVLTAHLRRTSELAAATRSAVEEVLRGLPSAGRRTVARLGGAELASAVRQVAPAAAAAGPPALAGVLVELGGGEVRLVASDRYRLALRVLRPVALDGDGRRLLVAAAALREAAAWALPEPEVEVVADGAGARLRAGARERELPVVDEEFPDYREMLAALDAPRGRVIVDRRALRDAVPAEGPVVLRTARDGAITVGGTAAGGTALRGVVSGAPPSRVAFDPAVLLPALEASVGPDVLLELASDAAPVVVRSADQGSFTTLVMPVRVAEG